MKFLKTDIKRIFTEPAFWLSVFSGLMLYFGALVYLYPNTDPQQLYTRSQALALPFVAPLLAAMPYSVMIMKERETKFGVLMTVKLGKSGYDFKRLLTCGLSGAAALLIPQLILFAVCFFMGAVSDPEAAAFGLILPVTFGFGWAAASYGLTFVNKLSYVPLVMPQVLYLLCVYAFPHLKLERFYPPLDISPAIYGGAITADRFALPAALAVLGAVLTIAGKAVRER